MRILTLDAAAAGCSAALLDGDTVLSQRLSLETRGHAALLPVMVQAVLAQSGLAASELDLIAATVGPGSFTGLRAALSLAHGIALGAGRMVTAVGTAEALAESVPAVAGRTVWVAITSRRDRVFLGRGDGVAPFGLDALPQPAGPVMVAGDAAIAVASRLAARGADVMLTQARRILPRSVAAVAVRRAAGALPPLAAQPLYVDPPEARLPAAGLRPPPR